MDRGRGARKVESLPQLPSLANMSSADSILRNSLYAYSSSADPAVVQNVYKSLNILNGHIAQLTPSLSASTTAAPSVGNTTATTSTAELLNSRVVSIDRELDDLLTGSSSRPHLIGAATSGTIQCVFFNM